jgi:hypothetical protein
VKRSFAPIAPKPRKLRLSSVGAKTPMRNQQFPDGRYQWMTYPMSANDLRVGENRMTKREKVWVGILLAFIVLMVAILGTVGYWLFTNVGVVQNLKN